MLLGTASVVAIVLPGRPIDALLQRLQAMLEAVQVTRSELQGAVAQAFDQSWLPLTLPKEV